MTVYIKGMPETGDGLTPALVTAAKETGVDLQLEDGAQIGGWIGPVYDENGNVIPLETIRQALAQEDEESQYAQAGRILMGVEEE